MTQQFVKGEGKSYKEVSQSGQDGDVATSWH